MTNQKKILILTTIISVAIIIAGIFLYNRYQAGKLEQEPKQELEISKEQQAIMNQMKELDRQKSSTATSEKVSVKDQMQTLDELRQEAIPDLQPKMKPKPKEPIKDQMNDLDALRQLAR